MSANLTEMATQLSYHVWNRLLAISKDDEQLRAFSKLVERRFTRESMARMINRHGAWTIKHRGGSHSTSWSVMIYGRHLRCEISIRDLESKENLLETVKGQEAYEKRQRMAADIALIAKFRDLTKRINKLGRKRVEAATAEIDKKNGGGK